jgi:hypothetical protein
MKRVARPRRSPERKTTIHKKKGRFRSLRRRKVPKTTAKTKRWRFLRRKPLTNLKARLKSQKNDGNSHIGKSYIYYYFF